MTPDRPSATHESASRGRRWWWPIPVALAVASIALTAGAAQGGFVGAVTSSGGGAQSGSLVTAAASGGTTECDLAGPTYSPIQNANAANCSGSLTPAGVLPASASTEVSTTITDEGSLNPTAATVTAGGCGPIEMANSLTGSDPLLVRGSTLSYAQPGPLAGSTALGLNGSSATAADITPTTVTTNFTELIWFKTTASSAGGTLIGQASTPSTTTSPSTFNDFLMVVPGGRVFLGLYLPSGTESELKSTSAYADGTWHLAAATVSSTAGATLYMDGASVASTPSDTSISAAAQYWHIGWDDENNGGWFDPPTDVYFAGTLADAAVVPGALTAGQIHTLYTAASQTAWNTDVGGDGASDSWSLGDTGTTAYTGSVPDVSINPCSMVDATIQTTTTTTACSAPVSATSCSAPSSAVTLASLANTSTSLNPPVLGQPLTLTCTLQRDATNTITAYPYAAGLNLSLPLSISASAGSFNATLTWPAQDAIL